MTSLTSHQMLTLEEERDLVQSLASQPDRVVSVGDLSYR